MRGCATFLLMANAAALWAAEAPPNEPEDGLVNAIVAIVNNVPVTKLDVDARVPELDRDPKVTPDQRRAAWNKARGAAIEEQLLLQEAKRTNIEVDPADVNAEIQRLKELGVDAEGRRDLIRDQILIARLLQGLRSARAVTPQEVAEYYEKHPDEFLLPERRHILLIAVYAREFADSKAAARKAAEEVLERLKKGEDFGELARKRSHGPAADKGGDQGWVVKGTLVKNLEDAVAALKPGELSDLIETPDGFLIVKLVGIQPPTRQSLAEARPAILRQLDAERVAERRKELIERLAKNASIIRMDLLPKAAPKP